MARVSGFTKEKVDRFFTILQDSMKKHQFSPSRIFNIDETGLSIVQKPRKIVAEKGVKQIGRITSAERGKNITMIGTISASGTFIPPFLIYPRTRMNPQLAVGCFPNTATHCNPSGWSDGELFLKFLEHFVKCVLPSKERPVLLLLDGHASHKTLDAINFCRENGIIMITFPPHTSNKLQPLDVGVFGPFKVYLSTEMDKYMTNHPGERITDYVMGPLIKEAFIKAFSPTNILKGFEKSGIYPFNNDIFSDHEFMGAMSVISHPAAADSIIQTEVVSEVQQTETAPVQDEAATEDRPLSPQPGTSREPDYSENVNNSKRTPTKKIRITDISPLPIPKPFHLNKRKRKQEKSEEITASPYKLELEMKMSERKNAIKVTRNIGKIEAKKNKKMTSCSNKQQTCNEEQENDDNDDVCCLMCGEKYGLTQEEWIQCWECKQWCHENCSDFEKEHNITFVCDLCRK